MHQQVRQIDERRPRPRMRRSDDGLAKAVKRILALGTPSIVLGIVGCLCIALPIAFEVAGTAWWPLVVAYGGVLLGLALPGKAER